MRVLVISHGHPAFLIGGGEIIAYEFFQGLLAAGHDAYFLAGSGGRQVQPHPGTPFLTAGESGREFLFFTGNYDHFFHSHSWTQIRRPLQDLLESIQPEVIHFQHSWSLGLEWLHLCRDLRPEAVITYTLHEYLLMCYRTGQMLRTHDDQVCEGASPTQCSRCFPERSPADFRMRELFIKQHLSNVDAFVAPSRFLRQKFIEWGIPNEKIFFIENGRALAPGLPRDAAENASVAQEAGPAGKPELAGGARKRPVATGKNLHTTFGFFGQINFYKGVLVLLEAMKLLQGMTEARGIRLYLHGANLEYQSPEFREKFTSAAKACANNVKLMPPYSMKDLPSLMQKVGWVVIPSIWYENSPLVIQEAYMHGRPVICSDIGGMAEKVVHGKTGLHFRVGSGDDLAKTILQAANSPELWERLCSQIPTVFTVEQSVEAHCRLYEQFRRPEAGGPSRRREMSYDGR